MNISTEARLISDITRHHPNLLYYFPEEIQRALDEGRAAVLRDGKDLVGFGFWDTYANWVYIHTIYIDPKHRSRGIARQIIAKIKESLKQTKRAFIFTQVPAISHLAEENGFIKAPYVTLPISIWLKIVSKVVHPKRWLSYFKPGLRVISAVSPRLLIFKSKL